jgi:hypothetical protein
MTAWSIVDQCQWSTLKENRKNIKEKEREKGSKEIKKEEAALVPALTSIAAASVCRVIWPFSAVTMSSLLAQWQCRQQVCPAVRTMRCAHHVHLRNRQFISIISIISSFRLQAASFIDLPGPRAICLKP